MLTGMSITERVRAGQEALACGDWERARAAFAADLGDAESAPAWEGLSWAAWWLDDVAACLDARERAYRRYQADDDRRCAARMALWLGDDHLEFHGESAVANGWFGRAARILEDVQLAPEHGWLTAFRAHAALNRHDSAEAKRLAAEARAIGRRLGVVDIEMFALATEGLALVHEGAVDDGMHHLDEAAAAAIGGEFEALAAAGWTCCHLIDACALVRDYDRAAQWCLKVDEFSRRMRIQFVRGTCHAHYGAILTWHGDWERAELELAGATAALTTSRPYWRAEGLVRLGDLRRKQGRLAEAQQLFSEAGGHVLARLGLAELHLDRGDAATAHDLAARVLRRIPADHLTKRAGPLEILVRASVAQGAHEDAVLYADELREISTRVTRSDGAPAGDGEPGTGRTCASASTLSVTRPPRSSSSARR
jgi:tetratricopeptide (TPR) repeat protein